MTRLFAFLRERFERIPKAALFGVAAMVQIVLLAAMITDRAQILRDGTEVKLQTRPVDPRDLLRGDYVVLGYDISQLSSGPLLNQPTASRNPSINSYSRSFAFSSAVRTFSSNSFNSGVM